ncbi:unnamed protein product [Strongylus vulgaris]|uniref:Uncharacterized protein n=1 Tax=Strongylus vulgaris TaxID=40348 RepID=A0A3P7K542_STRVU|nr:unnamed protein product [Strongylus vulgaris]
MKIHYTRHILWKIDSTRSSSKDDSFLELIPVMDVGVEDIEDVPVSEYPRTQIQTEDYEKENRRERRQWQGKLQSSIRVKYGMSTRNPGHELIRNY